MEDFYPIRSENIPELSLLAKEALTDKDMWGLGRKENVISFLLPLVIDLLDDVERIKSLKNTFQEEYGGDSDVQISDGLWKVVEAYLEENNGTGNLLRLTEVLRSNDHKAIAVGLEKFLLRYSLPATSKDGESVNAYSLSPDCLQAEIKDIAMDSVTMWNNNSVEQALQNSVILEEIFKKLQFVHQKSFRVVSPTWMKETFPFWRKNARILIDVSANEEDDEHHCGITLSVFMDLWEKNRKTPDEVAKADVHRGMLAIGDTDYYKLQDHPFRSYQVSYENCSLVLGCGETENKFWKSCGLVMEDLDIKIDVFNTRICQRLLQGFCQNLKRLKISCLEWVNIPEDSSSSEDEKETKPNKKNQASSKSNWTETKLNFNCSKRKRMPIAENLHTLYLSYIEKESLRRILFICPNLKTLVLDTDEATLGALLSPTSTGKFIELKKLVFYSDVGEDLFSLRQYTEILAKNKFDCLEHLKLSTGLSSARSRPFNLYAALAQTGNNLKTLELELTLFEDLTEENLDWFIDLSPFPFPSLTELNFSIDWSCYVELAELPNFVIKFDFGTLKGMPMLKKLEINMRNLKEKALCNFRQDVLRRPGTQDWVFEGDRNRFLPTGVIVDYQYSANDPILCSNLNEFTFIGWSLTEEDARLLSSWFPNLTFLEAEVNHEALPILLENWPELEKLVVHTEKLISLRKLRPLKEKKKHLRLFQRFLKDMVVTDESVELKMRNGWLFFANSM